MTSICFMSAAVFGLLSTLLEVPASATGSQSASTEQVCAVGGYACLVNHSGEMVLLQRAVARNSMQSRLLASGESSAHHHNSMLLGGLDASFNVDFVQSHPSFGDIVDTFGLVVGSGLVDKHLVLTDLHDVGVDMYAVDEGGIPPATDSAYGTTFRDIRPRSAGQTEQSIKKHPRKQQQTVLAQARVDVVYDGPVVERVWPQAGSIMGGQVITVVGRGLHAAHTLMDAGGGLHISSLKPLLRVFFGSEVGGIECSLEGFASRDDSVKCVTPPLRQSQLNLTDVDLPVVVMKLVQGDYIRVPFAATQPAFTYSMGATPQLIKVSPPVVGPGDVLRIHALTCSGVVEAQPVELVRSDQSKAAASPTSATDTEVVSEPNEAWGHVCEPFPRRVRSSSGVSADNQSASDVTNGRGARGLDGSWYGLDSWTGGSLTGSVAALEAFLEATHITEAIRWIQPLPYLDHRSEWVEGLSGPHVVEFTGWLQVQTGGEYSFELQCHRKCFLSVDNRNACADGSRCLAGWHNDRLMSEAMPLGVGWHTIRIVHLKEGAGARDAVMFIKYSGPDTSGTWRGIAEEQLRAGISHAQVRKLNEQHHRQAVGYSPEAVRAAKIVPGSPVSLYRCPTGNPPKTVEFRCRVSDDHEPGNYNVKFHDHSYGISTEAPSALWRTREDALEFASVRVLPRITSVTKGRNGGLLVDGKGLDHLPASLRFLQSRAEGRNSTTGKSALEYGGKSYAIADVSQDKIELQPVSVDSEPGAGDQFLGSRGLLRETWFENAWPGELQARGVPANRGRAAQLRTPIEELPAGSTGFAERLSGVLVPPFSGSCRFGIQGTQTDKHDTYNRARVYLSEDPIQGGDLDGGETGPAHGDLPAPAFGFEGSRAFTRDGPGSDLVDEGVIFSPTGAMSIAMTIRWGDRGANNNAHIVQFGHPLHGWVIVRLDRLNNRIMFQVFLGRHRREVHVNDKIVDGKSQRWLFAVASMGRMIVQLDSEVVGDGFAYAPKVHAVPYLHLFVGRDLSGKSGFSGEISGLRVYDRFIQWNAAHGGGSRQVISPVIPAPRAPVFHLPQFSPANDTRRDIYEFAWVPDLGETFAISFTARWNSLTRWTRIIDFGNGPRSDSIVIANSHDPKDLWFEIFRGGHGRAALARGVVRIGEEDSFLATVTQRGEMLIYRNGGLVGANSEGHTALANAVRVHNYVGKSNGGEPDFDGVIYDLKIFDGTVRRWSWAFGPDALDISALAPPIMTPVFTWGGRTFSGATEDFEDLRKVTNASISGAFSIALNVHWEESSADWASLLNFGNEASGLIALHEERGLGKLLFKVSNSNRRRSHMRYVRTSPALDEAGSNNFLVSVTERGQMLVHRNGKRIGRNLHGYAAPGGARDNLLVGFNGFKGKISNLRIFDDFARWSEVLWDGEVPQKQIQRTALLKSGLSVRKDLRRHISAIASDDEPANPPRVFPLLRPIEYPRDPVVATKDARDRRSDWFDLVQGQRYAFKLERRLAGRSSSTGVDGWKKLDLECRSAELSELNDEGRPRQISFPRRSEVLTIVLDEFPAELVLPARSVGYTLSFRGRTAQVKNDAGAGPSLLRLFGAECAMTGGDGAVVAGYEGKTPSGDAYCGIGSKTPETWPTGYWKESSVPIYNLGLRKLEEFPWFHMCYKIAPGALANLVVKCRVGGRDQFFSIGMTLPDPSTFHWDRKRAAQFLIHTGPDGQTDGQWHCGSLNLLEQVTGFSDYERRFRGIDYTNGGANAYKDLAQMEVDIIYLASPVHRDGAWQPLAGSVSVDQVGFSPQRMHVTQTSPSPLASGPRIGLIQGEDTRLGWTVEWFSGTRFFNDGLLEGGRPVKTTKMPELTVQNCEVVGCSNWGFRASAILYLDLGEWQFHAMHDDAMKVYINGTQIYDQGCCTRGKWSELVNVTRNPLLVQVLFVQTGGNAYAGLGWRKVGTQDIVSSVHNATIGSSGVIQSHFVRFFPEQRPQLLSMQSMLREVLLDGVPVYVGLPKGLPSTAVSARLAPVSSEWLSAVSVLGDGSEFSQNIGEDQFNRLFRDCPVVRYKRNAEVHSYYVRKSQLPASVNPYKLFTQMWSEDGNVLGVDFDIFSNLWEARARVNAWTWCTYDVPGAGYPGDCGRSGRVSDRWFANPGQGASRGLTTGASLHIHASAGCPSSVGQPGNLSAPDNRSVTFDMDDDATDVMARLQAAGFPGVDLTLRSGHGVEWLDLSHSRVVQSSTAHGGVATRAIDGQRNVNWRAGSCTHTNQDPSPWWMVSLGGKRSVAAIRMTAHNGDAKRLTGFDVLVDGKVCAKNIEIAPSETLYVPCVMEGSSVVIVVPRREWLVICEVEIGVMAEGADGERVTAVHSGMYSLGIRYEDANDPRRIVFDSPSASHLEQLAHNTGTRFWKNVGDDWFRTSHTEGQVRFGDWLDYICETGLEKGCAPMITEDAEKVESPLSLLALRAHTARGMATSRRVSVRRWRAPSLFHTPETLEMLRRRVFGFAVSPKGWAATTDLLQQHAGKQRRFQVGGEDPRSDPHRLRWSSPSSWGGEAPPNGNTTDLVFIPEGKTALLDVDVNIRFWIIEGNLVWDNEKDIHMQAEAIVVNGGSLLIGSAEKPYEKHGRITLHGHWHSFKLPLCGTKTLFQTRGNVEMHGKPVAVTWTELNTTAEAGSREIVLRQDVDWKPGDLIVVAASDKVVKDCRLDRRDDCQVEERYVRAVEGKRVTLDRPLEFRHVAFELDPHLPQDYCSENPALCLRTQVRSEVGLLSRNIRVSGSNPEDGTGPAGSEGFGAHLMHAERAQYTYVEFHWMGQAFQMGRYPLHFHQTGLNPESKVVGCSVHRTFQRGITVHGTHRALIKDNVVYNHLSHGYFIEDGNEHDNVFENNLGLLTHRSLSMLNSDQTPATFWIRNPSNYFRNNHAAGSAAFGFWFDTLPEASKTLQRQFENNTAHSNGDTGVWIDVLDSRRGCESPDDWTVEAPFRDSTDVSQPQHANSPACEGLPRENIPFLSTTTWGNADQGITSFENGHVHFINHRSVSDGVGLLVWGVQSDNWPDETNGWYGPTVRHSVYHSQSALSSAGFETSCSVRLPWDDTLHVTGTQFIGTTSLGHFCPCHQGCNAQEGGYQHRTSALGWHEGAGTSESPRVRWPWPMAAFFFDLDGTLAGSVENCSPNGCYVHSRFDTETSGTQAPRASDTGEDASATALLQRGQASTVGNGGCLDPLVGRNGQPVLDNSRITASSYHRNRPDYGKGEMWRSRLHWRENSWCSNALDEQQFLQWDFETPRYVQGVRTQGRPNADHWVKSYRLSYTVDGSNWSFVFKEFVGNRDRSTVQELRVPPMKVLGIRLHPTAWHGYICMRADLLGCDGSLSLESYCVNKAYLNDDLQNCMDIARSFNGSTARMSKEFCEPYGAVAKYTPLSANGACCACGGGSVRFFDPNAANTTHEELPPQMPRKALPGGTAYLPPDKCRLVDETGGIVCDRDVRMQTVTVKHAGVWHRQNPILVQSDYGFAKIIYATCYKQYEFSVFQGMRHMLLPPLTPTSMADWDFMRAEVTMRAGDKFVIQVETIHNPDGWTVKMPGVSKDATCDDAPVKYASDFAQNETIRNMLQRERDTHSASTLNLSLAFDLYKVAHIPLLDSAEQSRSAGNWGYLPANASVNVHEWYPGMFSFLLTERGVVTGDNHVGPWNGLRVHPGEKMVTRPVSSGGEAAGPGFSHVHTRFSWSRWDRGASGESGQAPEAASRLEFLSLHCGVSLAAFGHLGQQVRSAVQSKMVVSGTIRRFKWSQWPSDLGGKPTLIAGGHGVGNVTIEADWEVTLDEDVDFINKLDIEGVLKFEDKVGCCRLAARYVLVGPFFGRLEAGTAARPFRNGRAHIILKGHPMTPGLGSWHPHIAGSAKWMKSKFIAVQGSLSLHGEERGEIWSRIAQSSPVGATSLRLQGGGFRVGDVVAVGREAEIRTLVRVQGVGNGQLEVFFDEPLSSAYKGVDHVHLGMEETRGLMAASVALVEGHNVIVEGEDTPGVPMCSVSETQICPYQEGLTGGANLHDFAKEVQHHLESSGSPGHPNCRPCGAVSEMHYAGYIIAMAHFHKHYDKCPKDHGKIQVSGVAFDHAASMHLYHDYSAGNYPYDVPKNFQSDWARRPHSWWRDPVWQELAVPPPFLPYHQIVRSSFNNTVAGNAFALATSGVHVFPTLPVSGNVVLRGGVGINGAARRSWSHEKFDMDEQMPNDDNAATVTQGVGSPNDDYNGPWNMQKYSNVDPVNFEFASNYLIRAHLTVLRPGIVRDNVLTGSVRLEGVPLGSPTPFANNVVNAPDDPACIFIMTGDDRGVSDSTVFGCQVAVGFRQAGVAGGAVRRMRILDSDVGLQYFAQGHDGKKHDSKPLQFVVADSSFYARADHGGVGMTNPKVHSSQQGNGIAPDWWNIGGKSFPLGHSTVSIDFSSTVVRTRFVGYKAQSGGVAFAFGEFAPRDTTDADHHPMHVSELEFVHMDDGSRFRALAETRGSGMKDGLRNDGLRQCLQIDCDGLRNLLLVDRDGSLLGQPGTVVPKPQKFYEKLAYVDALGFETMEDLIPFPQRYDRFGDAIPFPENVEHGSGGGIEGVCGANGCDVLFPAKGSWVPRPDLALGAGARVVALQITGKLARLDQLFHGWALAGGWVRVADSNASVKADVGGKPESQHARRFGRVSAENFGSHPNASKVEAVKGPVYTVPGVWRKGCTFDSTWQAYKCPGSQHTHLILEVMDWNHMDRRWAPVTVEVNDGFQPQGGAMNVLTGPAMMWPGKRLQTFHALGHVGLRHNVYFSADPPKHLRLHLPHSDPSEGVIVCVYYGVPNTVAAYVDGQRVSPLEGSSPTWDNLVLTKLTPDMPHGTHFYDRIGVETGRPGYVYVVVRGGKTVDLKISHKILLTTKVNVTADWGGWKNESSNHFFKKGLNGLVRNIALLVGIPESRISVLGEGSAQKGAFWNEETTSKAFAEWMWTQNQSMDAMSMDRWLSAPALNGIAMSRSNTSGASDHDGNVKASLLARSGNATGDPVEDAADDTDEHVEGGVAQILGAQKTRQELAAREGSFTEEVRSSGLLPVRIEVDGNDLPPMTSQCPPGLMRDCTALEEDSINKDEILIETQAEGLEPNSGVAHSLPVETLLVDDVPRMQSPRGWLCLPHLYDDGVDCDCDCGIWDPDCDGEVEEVFVVRESDSDYLNLIDKTHAATVLNVLDGDGNNNGVIDGAELNRLHMLGVSALFGAAERIIKAQEAGNNEVSQLGGRLGNFARVVSAPSNRSCATLLRREGLLPSKYATYRPMCVKDIHFRTVLGEATGRCALQPQMRVGSQCFVPTSGASTSTVLFGNVSSRNQELSTASVCGLVGRVFRTGQGVGGLRGSGVGITTAGLTIPGGEFLPGTGSASLDILAGGLGTLRSTLGSRGFSFHAVVRFDRFDWSAPIFTFSDGKKKIVAECRYDSPMSSGLRFSTAGVDGRLRRVEVRNILRVGAPTPLLFTISSSGHLSVWRRGVKVAEGAGSGPVSGPFSKMTVAGGRFEGVVGDIRMWSRVVTWNEAVAGRPRSDETSGLGDGNDADSESELDASCIASQRNTWDLVCDDVLPPELADDFGYPGAFDPAAKMAFESREDRGEVTSCGSDLSARSAVFHGKFGDGLTAEYFRMRTGCHAPFLFGTVPHTVRVDPTVDFSGGFPAPYNEYAVRWSGKLLVISPGTYTFDLDSKDGSWLAIGGRMLVSNSQCHSRRSRAGELFLDKGSHEIAVLYFNRGPNGVGSPGFCRLTYSGPDTRGAQFLIPQERLGSNPMRLSQLRRGSEDESPQNGNATTPAPGHFVYEEGDGLAVMPAGSCDHKCRQGLRKEGAAPFKFFCRALVEVSFVARVSGSTRHAMAWMDDEPLKVWDLPRRSTAARSLQAFSQTERRIRHENAHADEAALLALDPEDNFDIVRSKSSPVWRLGPGVHTLRVQGRIEEEEAFAIQRIRLDTGADQCTFFLEGTEKSYNDCRAQ